MAGSPCQPDHEEAVGGGQHTAARAALLPVAWIAKLSLRRRSHSADASGEDSRGRGSAGALDVLRRHWRAGQGGGSPSRTSRWDLLRTDRAFTLGFARRSSPTRAPDQQLHKGDEHTPAGESVLRSMGGWLSRTRRRLGSPINHVRLARARSAEPGDGEGNWSRARAIDGQSRPDGQSTRWSIWSPYRRRTQQKDGLVKREASPASSNVHHAAPDKSVQFRQSPRAPEDEVVLVVHTDVDRPQRSSAAFVPDRSESAATKAAEERRRRWLEVLEHGEPFAGPGGYYRPPSAKPIPSQPVRARMPRQTRMLQRLQALSDI
jgi:hypothetical protein